MKSKNQNEHFMLELAVTSAANEDGIATVKSRDAAVESRKTAWSPYEVWRTRVKNSVNHSPTDPAQI